MKPTKAGLEILIFEIPTGSEYVFRCLGATTANHEPTNAIDSITRRAIMNKDIAATKLSEMMSGQPLALT